jgi:hypothetical protein
MPNAKTSIPELKYNLFPVSYHFKKNISEMTIKKGKLKPNTPPSLMIFEKAGLTASKTTDKTATFLLKNLETK